MGALRQQRADYTDPTLSVPEFYQTFMATVPGFAQAAESLERGPQRETLAGAERPSLAQLPLPLEAVAGDEVQAAFFPEGEPDPSTALGAAFMWWVALLDMDNYQTVLEDLTWHPPAWDGFTHAREELEGWALAQNVHANVERPDQVAYVKFIPDSGVSARLFADAVLPDVQILTLVRCDDGWWRVWGLSRNRMPSYEEVTGTAASS